MNTSHGQESRHREGETSVDYIDYMETQPKP